MFSLVAARFPLALSHALMYCCVHNHKIDIISELFWRSHGTLYLLVFLIVSKGMMIEPKIIRKNCLRHERLCQGLESHFSF